jgi:hypothetical protein
VSEPERVPVATRNEAITAAHTIGVAARREGGQNGEEAVVHEAAEDQRPEEQAPRLGR